jgi:peptide/nickel transport system permease protein
MTAARAIVVRLAKLVGVVLIVSFLMFCLTKMLPGNPVQQLLQSEYTNLELREAVERDLGLDKPFLQQYWDYIRGVVTEGDLGKSYQQGTPTTTRLAAALPATLQLMLMAQLLSLVVSVPLALYSAYRANTRVDKLITTGTFGLISIPGFALAPFLVFIFALRLGWFPAIGYDRITGPGGLSENLKSVALPVIVLSTGLTAVYTRLLRSDLIATLQEDFVLMARSKGLPTWHIMLRHALRPSSFSLITVFGINFGALIGGTIIVERFFTIPGVGLLAVEAIPRREYLVLQGVVLVIATSFVVINFLTDLLYSVLDPRVRRAGAS